MALIRPFRAVRPEPGAAHSVAAVPYDVVDTAEARALAAGNPLSFLHVSRAEIDLPDTIDPHDAVVYDAAAERYRRLTQEAPLVQEREASFYLYQLDAGGHSQVGVAACYSLAEYDTGRIKKHERTRKDKEDDRTRHILALRAQTGPVFLTHRPHAPIDELARRVRSGSKALVDFEAADGVRHAIWRVGGRDASDLARAFESVDALYIADGHHRAASAARARHEIDDAPPGDGFLAVAFPSDQVLILAYNRVVSDLGGRTPEGFLMDTAGRFSIAPGAASPEEKGRVSMYVDGVWYTLDLGGNRSGTGSGKEHLDCDVLQEEMLWPILGIQDVRTDRRIDFVGGAKGTGALEQLVDSGKAAVAFSMYPVSITELMDVSDAGGIMPPKSTWFEPKLRDGLLIHEI